MVRLELPAVSRLGGGQSRLSLLLQGSLGLRKNGSPAFGGGAIPSEGSAAKERQREVIPDSVLGVTMVN